MYHPLNLAKKKKKKTNYLSGSVIRVWNQEVSSPVVSGSSPMVANMMITGGLHGR
jgi:hypothetical protein